MMSFVGLTEVVVAIIGYTLTLTSSSSVSLYTGESATATFTIKNNNWFATGYCKFRVDTNPWSSWYTIYAGETRSFSVSISAPPWGSGSGSIQRTIYTSCYDSGDPTESLKSVSITITYTENPEYIKQVAKTNADSARSAAQSAISSASLSISSAQSAINEAKNEGADVSSAELKLSTAQSNLQIAQSKMSSSNSYYNQDTKEGYDLAASTANEATYYANLAKSDADSARVLAIQAKELIIQAKNNTQIAINKAKSMIDSANSLISSAQAAINEAKSIGADIIQAQTLLDTAITKVNSATSKYNDAVSQFNLKNYNNAKQYAERAEALALEAQTNARSAHTSAILAKEKYLEEQRQAQLLLQTKKSQAETKLSEGQKKYNEVVDLINETNTLLILLSEMNINTTQYKQEVEGYSKQILEAKGEIEKAERRYKDGDYDESKSYSVKSLDITLKISSDLNNILYNMALAAQQVALKKQNESIKVYEISSKMVDKFEENVTGAQFSEFKDNLIAANTSIAKADTLLKEGDALLNNKKYIDAVNSYRDAFSELSNAGYLSSKVALTLNSTIEEKLEEAKGVCGPIFILLLASLPLMVSKRWTLLK